MKLTKKIVAAVSAAVMAAGLLAPTTALAGNNVPANQAAALGMSAYYSELTGEPTPMAIAEQRPIAAMIDNDQRALPHYGLGEADVVYEMVNSIANNRITRLMALYKNWNAVPRIGNIRSTRPTNILLSVEWNAVLCHDGGPFYNNPYFAAPYAPAHFSGTFSRVNNGKATEFTEYILTGDLNRNFARGTSVNYTQPVNSHFNFTPFGTQVNLADKPGVAPAAAVSLPFYNTKSRLVYNAATQTYDYYEFGAVARDGDDKQVVSFKNVIIQNCTYHQYDKNGYLIYNVIDPLNVGYYLTNGQIIPIMWIKAGELGVTQYYDAAGAPLIINTGKTYIGLVPNDTWAQVTFQ